MRRSIAAIIAWVGFITAAILILAALWPAIAFYYLYGWLVEWEMEQELVVVGIWGTILTVVWWINIL